MFIRSMIAAGAAVAFAVAAGQAPAPDISLATTESTFPLADPDTVRANDGSYVTYGTTVGAGVGARCGATGQLYVPVLAHGSGSSVGMANCASADAMPAGPGDWASGAIWAPGVARFGNQYFMYYTASKAGTGQKCIGRAVSANARGPFTGAGEWACPPAGRWALDANPFVANGSLYVAYRDDAITSGAETGISVVRTDANGWAIWSTRRDALKSTDISWDSINGNTGTNVVENPSMFQSTDGQWYLAYAGNNWDSVRYATGIASCGSAPIPASRCVPLQSGVQRPYFGYTGAGGLGPYRGLPGNRPGPGGMDVFTAADGTARVVYHWWNGSTRFPVTGVLGRDAGGFLVS